MNKCCRDIIALNFVRGLTRRGIHVLLNNVKDTEEIFNMSPGDIASLLGIENRDFDGLRRIRVSERFLRELGYVENSGIRVLCCKDEDYPETLRNIYDPPALLYVRGTLKEKDSRAVSIVGSRKCSSYGLKIAEELSYELARYGITIISGMARGIDSACHRGAIKAGGRTLAVMGTGFRRIYPPESTGLSEQIVENGALITEYTSETGPGKFRFPERNRLISAFGKGLVVVEAGERSGAMITVNMALEQGKEVFSVPGRIDRKTSLGTNRLIKEGAKAVTSVEDILEELKMELSYKDQ